MGTSSVFLWGPGFPVFSRRIAWRVSSLIWVVQGERLAVLGEIVCRKAKGPLIESECPMVQRDLHRGGERPQKQQRDRSGARQSETTPQIPLRHIFKFPFGVSQRKGHHPGEGDERTGRTNALHSWERYPTTQSHGVECPKVGKEPFAERPDAKTKGEGPVKSNAEEPGSGAECKGDASQSKTGPTGRSHLMDHSSRWLRAPWTVRADPSGAGKEDQTAIPSAGPW